MYYTQCEWFLECIILHQICSLIHGFLHFSFKPHCSLLHMRFVPGPAKQSDNPQSCTSLTYGHCGAYQHCTEFSFSCLLQQLVKHWKSFNCLCVNFWPARGNLWIGWRVGRYDSSGWRTIRGRASLHSTRLNWDSTAPQFGCACPRPLATTSQVPPF